MSKHSFLILVVNFWVVICFKMGYNGLMVKKALIALLLVISPAIEAKDLKLLDLEYLRVDYLKFNEGGRDPLINNNGLPNQEPNYELDLEFKTTLLSYGYLRGLVHSMTSAYADSHTNDQFRTVGLNLELGVRVCPYFDVFMWHYSQHLLDTNYVYNRFPVNDAIGLHFYIYNKDNRKESLIH